MQIQVSIDLGSLPLVKRALGIISMKAPMVCTRTTTLTLRKHFMGLIHTDKLFKSRNSNRIFLPFPFEVTNNPYFWLLTDYGNQMEYKNCKAQMG